MSDYRIEAATKEEWAERALRAEARIEELEAQLAEADALAKSAFADGASNNIRLAETSHRIEELEAKLERISEEWGLAVYGDLESGVASLNAAAATDFCRRYPLVSAFGETLYKIIDGETDGR